MAAGLIVKDGRLLMVHNAKHGLRVEPPGGKRREGEGWEESVVREIAEELGLEVRPGALFGVYDTHSPEGEFVVRMYLCEITAGQPRVLEPEKVPGFGWYSYDELVALRDNGTLVPNMVAALVDLKAVLSP